MEKLFSKVQTPQTEQLSIWKPKFSQSNEMIPPPPQKQQQKQPQQPQNTHPTTIKNNKKTT